MYVCNVYIYLTAGFGDRLRARSCVRTGEAERSRLGGDDIVETLE